MTTPTPTPGQDRPTRALIAAVVLGPSLAAAGTFVLLTLRDDLPAQIAVHWGLDGTPDRTVSFIGALVTAVVVTVLAPVIVTTLALVTHRSARGPLAALAVGVTLLAAGLSFGSVLVHRGATEPVAVPVLMILGVLTVATLVGVAVGWWARPETTPLEGARPPMPEDAARLAVPDTTRLAWTGRAGLSPRATLVVAAVLAAGLIWAVTSLPGWLWLVLLLVAAVALAALSARVVVDTQGLRVTSLGITLIAVPVERVAHAETGSVSALREFGGWGWRIGVDGRRGYVTRSGDALVVHRIDDTDVVVTIDDPEQAAAVLNTLAARTR